MSVSANSPRDNKLPESLLIENRTNQFQSIIWPLAFFILFFAFWIGGRELFRQEGLYASCAREFVPGFPVTAHGVIQKDVPPLFPALVSMLNRLGISMECALRLLSIIMLGAWSLLAALVNGICHGQRNRRDTGDDDRVFPAGRSIEFFPFRQSAGKLEQSVVECISAVDTCLSFRRTDRSFVLFCPYTVSPSTAFSKQ